MVTGIIKIVIQAKFSWLYPTGSFKELKGGCLSTWIRADSHTENVLKLAHFLKLRKFGA